MAKLKSSGIETTTLVPVPMHERKTWLDACFIQAGVMICVPSMLLGGTLAQYMSLSGAILAGVVGYLIDILLFSLMGVMGSDLGVPTCVTTLGGFGEKGSRFLISVLIFISMMGWFAVQNSVCGNAFSTLLDQFFGISLPVPVSTAIWGIVMLVTAVYGINALNKLNKIAVPSLLIITIIGTYLAIKHYGTAALFVENTEASMSFMEGVVLTISFMAAGCLAASDITRYQRTRREAVLSSCLGVAPAGVLMVILGAIMTRVAQEYDITVVFCEIGIPVIGMLVLIIATWTTNTANAYSGGINATLVFGLSDDKRAMATMVSGALGTVLALLGLADHFDAFLTIIGNLLLPTMGVILADYWILSKGNPRKFTMPKGVNIPGLVSWFAGWVVIQFVPYGVPFAQGMLLSAVLYLILVKVMGKPEGETLPPAEA